MTAKNVAVFRHGDDFVVCGTRTQQAEFKSELGQYFIVIQLAILGPSPALGDVPEVRILNRLVRWVKPPYGSEAERLEMTKYLTETILNLDSKDSDWAAVKDLDSQCKKLEPKFVEQKGTVDSQPTTPSSWWTRPLRT